MPVDVIFRLLDQVLAVSSASQFLDLQHSIATMVFAINHQHFDEGGKSYWKSYRPTLPTIAEETEEELYVHFCSKHTVKS